MKMRTKVVGAVVAGALALSAGAVVGAQAQQQQAPPTNKAGSSSPTESSFVPITPCRIVNTQNPAGKLSAGEVRSYHMHGNTSEQGGAAACGIPSVATALEMSITAVGAEGNGYLRVYPAGQPEPNATFLNYTDVFNAENAGTVRVQAGLGNNLSVKAYQKRTHVVIDVLGYYVANPIAVVSSAGNLLRGSAASGASRDSLGTYRVTFNRNVSGCVYTGGLHDPATEFGNEGDIAIATSAATPQGIYVQTYNAAGNLADLDFHVTVTC